MTIIKLFPREEKTKTVKIKLKYFRKADQYRKYGKEKVINKKIILNNN